jgi:glycosyltransferase involved in cell wall biosynthesis
MKPERVILLLGRRDQPTDGVRDYCEKLRESGAPHGLSFDLVPVPWAETGWRDSLAELRKAAATWQDRWVLLQYTTLAWSQRGFPLYSPRLLEVLRQGGARPGLGIVGHAREYCQLRVLRQLYSRSDLAIFTVPIDKLPWLPLCRDKAVFIPVGANCPEAKCDNSPKVKTVAVYSITGAPRTSIEVADIGTAMKRASKKAGPVRLVVFGRGSQEAEPALRSELAGTEVEIESLGLLTPEQVSQALIGADVLLFVRGHISSRRGSAIAGIATGLPIVCYAGLETAWPITEAGIFAVPLGDREALAEALETVLSDDPLRKELAVRSRQAQEKYFSWAAIVERFGAALGTNSTEKESDLTKKSTNAIRVA